MQLLRPSEIRLYGNSDNKIRQVASGVLSVIDMEALADYYRNTLDMFATGEFWGKIMRALCLISEYTGDEKLKTKARNAANDMLFIAKEKGHISTVPVSTQPNGSNGSDLWERKYALMGMLYYYEMTGEKEVLDACKELVKYTENQVGDEAGKTSITKTGWAFYGIESSSIIQPLMHYYNITKDPAALKLGLHIINSGACDRENIFEAVENGKKPKDIGGNGNPKESIAKAYEMMSCFEGILEFYKATGNSRYLNLGKKFWEMIVDDEITILGSGGADAPFNLGPGTGEQWNNTKHEQTNPDIDLMMETCVTVYWMRLSGMLFLLTGEAKYIEEMERSIYNAIFGALRPDGCFFEYFPKLNGKRNNKVNYSFNIKGFDLSCCTANGPTALGMIPEYAYTTEDNALYVNLYESADFSVKLNNEIVTCHAKSEYPGEGRYCLKISSNNTAPIYTCFRVPAFAVDFSVKCGKNTISGIAGTYLRIKTDMSKENIFEVSFKIPVKMIEAPMGSNRLGDDFVAFTYGNLVLSRDQKDGEDVDCPIDTSEISGYEIIKSDKESEYVKVRIHAGDSVINFRDYQSCGIFGGSDEFRSWIKKQ